MIGYVRFHMACDLCERLVSALATPTEAAQAGGAAAFFDAVDAEVGPEMWSFLERNLERDGWVVERECGSVYCPECKPRTE